MEIAYEDAYQPERVKERRESLIMISGCSGGGKSSLLTGLAKSGYRVYAEPGRQVVKEQMAIGGDALPWLDLPKFVDLTISRSINFMIDAASMEGISFFDRGIIDQISGLQHAGFPVPAHYIKAADYFRYNSKVFTVPPWREIYRIDSERKHSFEDAVSANDALVSSWKNFGYEPVMLPKLSVDERIAFITQYQSVVA